MLEDQFTWLLICLSICPSTRIQLFTDIIQKAARVTAPIQNNNIQNNNNGPVRTRNTFVSVARGGGAPRPIMGGGRQCPPGF